MSDEATSPVLLRESCPRCLKGARGCHLQAVTCVRCGRVWTIGERQSVPAIHDLGRNTGLLGRRKAFGDSRG